MHRALIFLALPACSLRFSPLLSFFHAAHPAYIASSQRYRTQKNELMRDLSERLDLAEGPYPKKLVEHARIFVKGQGGVAQSSKAAGKVARPRLGSVSSSHGSPRRAKRKRAADKEKTKSKRRNTQGGAGDKEHERQRQRQRHVSYDFTDLQDMEQRERSSSSASAAVTLEEEEAAAAEEESDGDCKSFS